MEKSLVSALQGKKVVINQGALLLEDLPAVARNFVVTHRLNKPFGTSKLALLVNMMAPREIDTREVD